MAIINKYSSPTRSSQDNQYRESSTNASLTAHFQNSTKKVNTQLENEHYVRESFKNLCDVNKSNKNEVHHLTSKESIITPKIKPRWMSIDGDSGSSLEGRY